jgi:vitamin B12 transporter
MKKMILGLAAVLTMYAAKAQTSKDTIPGEDATITASKTWRKQTETGKVITIIDQKVIQTNLGKTTAELLQLQTGVTMVGANNALGTNQDIYIRGNGKVLFLLDGVPLYDASTIGNSFDVNSVALENLERIEILKGAHSTLYGSDAVAAVVNFITKKKTNKVAAKNVHLNAGSFGSYRASAGVYGNTEGIQYSAQYTFQNSKGFSTAKDTLGNQNFDKDDFTQHNLSTTINGKVDEKVTLGAQFQYSQYKAGIDAGAFKDDRDYTIKNLQLNAGVNAQFDLKKGKLFYAFSATQAARNYLNDSIHKTGFSYYSKEKYEGTSYFTELYLQHKLYHSLDLVAGVDHRWQNSNQDYLSVSSFGPYKTSIGKDSVKHRLSGAFASLLWKQKQFNLELGGRYNKHNLYGNNTTFTFNPSYNFNAVLKAFVNVSSAFKAPSLYQLFGPGVANRTLMAEKSLTSEVGLAYSKGNYTNRIVLFSRNIKNGIDYNLNTYSYFNNNTQKDYGVELENAYKTNKWNIQFNYAFVDGKVNTWKFQYDPLTWGYIITGDTTYNNLYRRPKHSANVLVQYMPTTKWVVGMSARIVGERTEGQFLAAPLLLKPYTTADLHIGYQLNTKCRFYGDVRNITNADYMDVRGFNTRPRNITFGMQFIF